MVKIEMIEQCIPWKKKETSLRRGKRKEQGNLVREKSLSAAI
jgi:hypothetical protein